MQNKTVKLFALGALAAATTFGASAENTYDYFVGFDAGTQVVKLKKCLQQSLIDSASGLSGGVIINDQ